MTHIPYKALALLTLASATILSGCASTRSFSTPVEVTRFASAEKNPLSASPIMLEIGITHADNIRLDGAPSEFRAPVASNDGAYLNAVANELEALGFAVTTENAPYVATISVERFVEQAEKRSPVSVGGNASMGSYGSGVGLGIGIDLSGPDPDRIDTLLSIRIRPADDANRNAGNTRLAEAIWEGRARFTASANNELADPDLAAERLATALFSGFPGRSGETIVVE